MASVFTHAFVAAAMGRVYAGAPVPARFWLLSMACAVLPDADVLAFFFGIAYGDTFGHRGFTHSLAFALLLGVAVVLLFFPETRNKRGLVAYFSLVTASHAVLDALTNGGLGVALFAPFSDRRYFFPWRPLEVSPIGVGSFFTEWGLVVIKSELAWVWLPCSLVVAAVLLWRKSSRRGSEGAPQ